MARLALLVILALAGLPATASATHPGGNELLAADAEVLGTNTSTIYVGKRDGSGLRALPSPCPPGPLDFLERCYAATPAWSPDGRTIAFTVLRQAREEIWLVEADGSGLRQVPGAFGTSPSWSPDGSMLAFAVDPPFGQCGRRWVHTIGIDGSGLRRLTRRPSDHPDWSSRGDRVLEAWLLRRRRRQLLDRRRGGGRPSGRGRRTDDCAAGRGEPELGAGRSRAGVPAQQRALPGARRRQRAAPTALARAYALLRGPGLVTQRKPDRVPRPASHAGDPRPGRPPGPRPLRSSRHGVLTGLAAAAALNGGRPG